MALTFSEDDSRRMQALQADLTTVLARANDQHLEAAVAAFALLRCARVLIDKYPAETRQALLEVVVAFLRRDDVQERPSLLVNVM